MEIFCTGIEGIRNCGGCKSCMKICFTYFCAFNLGVHCKGSEHCSLLINLYFFVHRCWLLATACSSHHQGPIFKDGMKEWSCCKKRSHDFSEFLGIPGCKTGKHTTEKPSTKAVTATRTPRPAVIAAPATNASSKESCSRCRQGFFCSDHGSTIGKTNIDVANANAEPVVESSEDVEIPVVPQKKIVDINQPQTCKNKGCGQTFKEKDNHETACCYHPGPAVFHDRMRGWKCCDVHVKEFDEFMTIPPCTKGWHNADPTS